MMMIMLVTFSLFKSIYTEFKKKLFNIKMLKSLETKAHFVCNCRVIFPLFLTSLLFSMR